MKNIQNDFIEGIGNTPLIKLRGPSELTGCNIYGKAEYLNPGGSIKDRAAWALIKDAEEKKINFRRRYNCRRDSWQYWNRIMFSWQCKRI